VNQIMALTKLDRTMEPQFGAGPGNLAFTDVPVQANGQQVLILRAFVVDDAMSIARAEGGVESVIAQSSANFASGQAAPILTSPASALSGSSSSTDALAAIIVPEPASAITLIVGAFMASSLLGRRRP
jgi:hypothetical protein